MNTVFGKTMIERRQEALRLKTAKRAALSILAHAWVEAKVYDKDTAETTCAKIERIQEYVERAK